MKPQARKKPTRMLVEELEPRILYSADAAALVNPAALAPSAEIRSLDVYAAPADSAAAAAANTATGNHAEAIAPVDAGTAAQAQRHEIVFVDTSVDNYQQLLADLANDPTRSLQTVLIDGSRDGVAQITQALAGQHDIDAIHIISHGANGELELGSTVLGSAGLLANATAIRGWGDALSADGDILLYGCDVAADGAGRSFVDRLAQLTGSDVSASTDATGYALSGGNWKLEYQTGAVETSVALDDAAQQDWHGLLAIAANGTVTSAQTGGATSLTWSHTVAAGTNRALFVELQLDSPTTTVTSVTYNGVALTQVGRGTGSTGSVEIWALTAPSVTTANVVANFSASVAASGGATTYNGVHQSMPADTFASASGTGTTGSVTVSSAPGEVVVDSQYYNGAPSGGALGGGQTLQWWQQVTTAMVGGTTSEAGASSVVMSGNFSSSTQWVVGGVSIKAAGVNIAPTLSGSNNLTAITEDPASNAGTLVSALISGKVTDPDAGALAGIAVIAADNTNGTWQYSTNSGGAWTAFGTPGATTARLLASDGSTYVRFVPNANWNGTVSSGLTFRAWDQSAGAAGSTTDTSNNGGSTAFSSATASGSISVSAANDQPVRTAGAVNNLTVLEDATATSLGLGTLAYGPGGGSDESGQTLTYTVTAVPASSLGDITLSDGTTVVTASTNYSLAQLQGMKFKAAANANGGPATFSWKLVDSGGTANGGGDTLNESLTVTITSVNDAPAGSDKTVTTLEDTDYVFTTADFGFTDPNDSPGNALANVKITTLPGAGTLKLSGVAITTGQFVSAANIAAGNLKFTPATNSNGTGYASFTFQVEDDGGTANGGVDLDATPNTITVNVTAVNDAPTITNGATVTLTGTNEDTTSGTTTVSSILTSASWADVDTGAVKGVAITSKSGNGTWQYSTDGVTWTAFGAVSSSNALLLDSGSQVRYIPDAQNGETATFGFVAWDKTSGSASANGAATYANPGAGGGATAYSSQSATASLTVTSVNDAPTIANGTTVTLTGTNEDTTSGTTTVSSILTSASWADVDTGAVKGIAITGKSGNGSWQYSTDGLTWTAIGAVSSSNALLLDSGSRVRYIPDGSNGETATFGFVAWDKTSGSASANGSPHYANPGAGGSSTAYSSQSATASMAVTAVNDAPTVADRALSFDGTDLVGVAPQPNLAMSSTLTIEAMVQRTGALSGNQIILNKEGEYEIGISANGKLQWAFANTTPGWNWVETSFTVPADTWVHVAVTYNSGVVNVYANGALVDCYNGTGTVGDTYPALNDLTIGGRQNTTGQRFVGLIDEVRVWNVERSGAQIQAAYNTVLAGNESGLVGYWRFSETSGATVIDSSTSGYNGLLGNGVAADSPTRTTNLDYTTAEDSLLSVAIPGVLTRATDPEGSALTATLVSGPSNAASFTLNANGSFSYIPSANFNGVDSFVFTANDGSLNSQQITVHLNVTAVNDAPAGADKTVTTPEDTDYIFSAADFGFTDPNDSPANALANVKITALPGAGSLTLSGVAVTAGQLVSVSSINAGNLKFSPAANANGSGYASFTFQVQDDGGTAASGIDLDASPNTITVNVTTVNDAPAGTDKTVTTVEDTDYVFTAADFGFTDPNDSPANALANVKITTLPGAGSLTLSGVAVTAGQFVSAANIAAGNLKFTPAANANGAGYASFTFQVQDDGGTANSGVDVDPSANTITVNVTAVNDAPTIANGATVTLTGSDENTTSGGTTVSSILTSASWADVDTGAVKGIAITSKAGNGTWQYSTDGVTWTAFGAVSSSSALLLDSGSQVRYIPDAQNGETATFGFVAWDKTSGSAAANGAPTYANPGAGGGSTAYSSQSATASLTVTSVNDAPTVTNGTTVTLTATNEDTASSATTVSSILTSASWADVDTGAVKGIAITSKTGNGTWRYSTDGVTWTAFGAVSSSNALLLDSASQVRYVPDGSNGETATFAFKAWDETTGSASANGTPSYANPGAGGGTTVYSSQAATASIVVSSVNDAPVLSGANNLTTILEDPSSNTGTLVSSLVSGQLSDADSGSTQGIAVIVVDNTNGTWQYSTNGGSSWNDFGSPSAAVARLLGADTNAYVRFVPNANWNGTVAGGITFRAWDQTSGAEGSTADTTTNGGTTAFSTATASSSITVTSVNDAPAGADKTVSVLEDGTYTFSAADFGFTDAADAAGTAGANALANVKITTLPGAGSLTLSGVAVTSGQFVSAANIAAGNLKFAPGANANGAAYGSFTFQVQDDGATANGGVDLDASPNTITVSVTPANDPPAGTDKTVTTLEDTAYTFAVADFGFTDPNDSPANALLNVQITTVPGAGSLTLSGVAVTPGQLVSAVDIAAGNLKFTPAPHAVGAAYASFTFGVQDDGGTANGGADLDTSPETITINVTAVNDAPAGADKTVTTLEDTGYTFSAADFGFTDPNDSPANALAAVKIATLPGAGTLKNNGINVSAGQFVTVADINAGRLVFTPAANANGAGYAAFTFQVQDDGGSAGGGANLDASPNTITVNVTPVNDEPEGASTTITTLEDTPYTLTAADFGYSDPLDSPANAFLAVQIKTLPLAGTLANNGVNVSADDFVSVADINAGKLVYTPGANGSGASYAAFTFLVQDDGGAANGGEDVDDSPETITFNVTAVNDEPEGTSTTVTTAEDTPYVFTASDFGFTDPDDSPANTFAAVKITTLPGAGTLKDNGVAVTAGQLISIADINTGKLVFAPAANANGAGYAAFTFQVQDNGGTANGGINLDASPETITIDVTAVNDAPVNSVPSAQDTLKNTPVTFSSGSGNAISVSDIDAAGSTIRVTLSVTNGTLTLAGTSGLSFSSGSGTSDAMMTFDGTVAAINAALDGLVYDPALNWSGIETLAVTTNDLGNTGAGGAKSTNNNVTINVEHTNSAPVLAGSNDLAPINEDQSPNTGTLVSALIAGQVTDVDAGASSGIAVTAVDNSHGTWQYSVNGGSSWSNFGAVTATSARLLAADANTYVRFVPATDWSGAVTGGITFQAWDQTTGSAGGTADATVNDGTTAFSAASASASVTVASVNDAPTGIDKLVATNEDTPYTFGAADFGFSDPDDSPANAFAAVKITTLPAAGLLKNDGVNVVAGQFVSIADIVAGKLAFTPGANANGAGYTAFTFQVEDDGGTANGGANLDSVARTMTIGVKPVNDAPVGTDKTVTTLEETAYVFSDSDFGLTDPNDTPANTLLAVKITTLPGAGTLTNNGVNVTAGQFVALADIQAGKLAYTPATDGNGAAYSSFTFQVQDNGGTLLGGADLDTTPRTMTVNVTPVNDEPVRAAGNVANVTVLEDSGLTSLGLGGLAYAPGGGADEAGQTFTYAVTAVPAAALGDIVLADGTTVVAPGTYTLAELRGMQFRTAANANGGPATFSFAIADSGGTANGGDDSLAESLTITVTPVNDAPARSSGNVTDLVVLEDSGLTSLGLGALAYSPGGNADESGQALTFTVTAIPPAGLGSIVLADGTTVVGPETYSLADLQGMQFRTAADAHGGPVAFSFIVNDDGGTAGGGADQLVQSLTITVQSVNDAPAGADKTVTTNEDSAYTFAAADFGFSDAHDSPANALANVKITTLPGAGTLTNDGAAVIAGQLVSLADINAGKLVFTAAADANGAGYASFTFQVEDNGGAANGGVDLDQSPNTITVNVTSVNDAPAGTDKTVTTLEDTAYAFTAADFGFTDPNDTPANALIAVKVTTLPGAGTLTNNGVNVSAGQLISIADLNAGKLVLTPVANANGAGYASFTFQVEDNGGTANGGADLDQSPNTITVNVTSVNDAPAGTDKTVTTPEETAYTFTAADFGFSDATDAASTAGADALAAVKITTLPGAGTLTNDGVAVSAGQFVTIADILAGKLIFTPAANANGAGYAAFTFQVEDDGGTAAGGVDLDQSPNTITVNVTSVNDAPAGTDKTVTTLEDTAYTFTAADFGFTDPNDTPANALIAVKLTTLPGAGTLTNDGVNVTAGQLISIADLNAGKLVFTPVANANGAGYASFTFQVEDNGGTASGGVDLDQSPNTVTVNVTSVNDAPAGTDKTVTTLEDTGYTFTAADFGFGDATDAASTAGANALAAVKITTLPGAGALTNNGIAVIAGQLVSIADVTAGKLVFTPAADANGAGYASFTFQVGDDGGTANGGVDLDQSPNTITIGVTSVNDAPAGANNTVTTLEDTAYIFGAADFGFTDPNDSPANALAAVKITTIPGAGTLTNDGVAVSTGQLISIADLNAGKLVFTPLANANGTGYASFTFQVEDDGGSANGGVDLDQSPNTITVNVTSVNDAPAGADKTVTTLEDTAYTFTAADFGFSDATDAANVAGADALAAVKITTLPGAGALTNNGIAVTTGQFVTVADILAGRLVFTPAADANGAGYAAFTFQMQDNGGTANGGVDLDQSPNTITFDVTSVNDAPAGADKTVTTLEDTAYTFTAADFGFGDVTDAASVAGADALAAVKITTLSGAGTLTNNGVAVSAGQFVTIADILAGKLIFTPAVNANGAGYAAFTFQVEDDGGTAAGGVDLDQSPNTITVDVTSVNDAPAGADKTVTTLEDTAYTFTAADFGFGDATDAASTAGADALAAVKITTLPGAGTLTNNGIAVGTGQLVTVADILAGQLVFTPAPNANGAGYASFTFQVEDDGGTANGGVDLDQSPNTITVDVASANDAPAGTDKTVTTLEDTAYTFTAADFGFTDPNDSPANAFAAVKITTIPGAGTLTNNGVAMGAGQFVTIADILAGRLVFTPVANANGAGYASFTFQVEDDGGTANSGIDLDQSPNTITVDVTSVNDAPAGADKTVTTLEDTAYTFTAADFGFGDTTDAASAAGANALAAVKITALPGAGTLTNNGVAVSAGQLVTIADILAGRLVFTPAADANGAGYASLTFQVEDDGGTANSGVDLDASANTITIDVTSVNDAPAGADKTVTMTENTAYTFSAADFGFGDATDAASAAGADALANVRTATLPGAGTLTNNGVAVTAGQFVTIADILAGRLVFASAAGANGAGYASFTFQVEDDGGTAAGGIDLDQSPNTITIDVLSANDAPAGADKTITTLEDTAYTFTAADFGFTDPNDSPANALAAVKITMLPGAGTLTNNGIAVTSGQFVSIADILAGRLVFAPAANANGTGYTSFTFQVEDDGGSANGGVDLDQSPNTITVNMTSVNDAPAGADKTVTTLEDTAYTFTTADFGFTDAADAGGAAGANALANVRITTLPGAGSLTDNGVAVGAGQVVSLADILAGRLVFTPAANANGLAYASFTFQLQDDGGTANGGIDLDASPGTITINVAAVNDAPTITSVALTVDEGATVTLSGASIGVTDLDSVSFTYTVSGIAGGYFQLATAPGVPVESFTSADLFGNRVQFVDDGNEIAPTFSVTASDGTSSSNTRTATITYNSVNDAPAVTGAVLAVKQGQAAALSSANINVTDPDSATFTYIVSAVSGGHFELTNAPGAAITTFTSAQLTGNTVRFVHDGSQAAPAFSVQVNDGMASSNTLAATIVYDTANHVATGAPTVAGQFMSGQTLAVSTAGISDPDGLGAFAFQWERSGDSGTTWTGIAGSTAPNYTLSAADIGSVVRVKVSYTDQQGTTEMLASGATAAIMGAGTSQGPKSVLPPPPPPLAPLTDLTPHEQHPGDARAAQFGFAGGRIGMPGPRPGAETMDAGAQSMMVRTSGIMSGQSMAAGQSSGSEQDGVRYQKPVVTRVDNGAALLAIRIDVGAPPLMAMPAEFLGLTNGARLEPSVGAVAGEERSGEDAVQDRASFMTAETGVKLSGAVVSAGFVIWALRGVGLLTTLLSSIPAWRHIDPVPILAPEDDRPGWEESDDQESVQEERAMSSLFASADGWTDRRQS